MEEEELVSVGEWASLDEAYEHALVVLAMNRDCRVLPAGDGFTLEVEPESAAAVRGELELYDEEQSGGEEAPPAPAFGSGLEAALLWAAVLVTVFVCQQRFLGLSDWGANASFEVFRDREWWRPVTSLFLHADVEHLLGNVLIGGVYCVLVGASFGAWRGWALILASGVAGNLLTAWVHLPERFYAIGASTATFGALGLLVGMGLWNSWRARRYRELKPLLVPLGVGVGLLGWFGSGGETGEGIDVLGHLFGWLSGLAMGWGGGWWITEKSRNDHDSRLDESPQV